MSAIVVESEANGSVDLTNAYGSKKLIFNISKDELVILKNALTFIHDNPGKFILFEMCLDEEREETLNDINEIIVELEKCIMNKDKVYEKE